MRILYVGDIMGTVGIEVVEQVLPQLRPAESIDVVIVQAENVSDGKSMTIADYKRLSALNIDGYTGGNHSVDRSETYTLFIDPNVPVVGPANMPTCPGEGYKYISTPKGKVLVISLLGAIVGKGASTPVDNPIVKIDEILESQAQVARVATVVNIHGDFSSEKIVMGHYLDGRVTAVIGDHWHVPTADAQVLPGGTAHQTDVGMCGALDSSLGVTYESVIPRWRDGKQTRNVMETTGRRQFNALLVECDDKTGLALSVTPIRQVIEA